MTAFHGDAELKTRLLARLDDAIAAQQIDFGPTAWDGSRGSVAGVVGEGDAAAFAATTGLPACLAGLLDMLVQNSLHDPVAACAFARAALQAIQVGAPVDGVPSTLVLHWLGDAAFTPLLAGPGAALGAAVAQLISLHQHLQQGLPLERRAWSAARAAVVAAADATTTEALVAIARVAEAAAWPPQQSKLLLTDVLQAWFAAREIVARASDPWSPEQDQQTRATLQALVEQHRTALQGGQVDLFALFSEHHPELAQGFRAQQERQQARGRALIRTSTDQLLAALARPVGA